MDYFALIKKEERGQNGFINLIASENYVSKEVLKGLGSVFTNKYAEGYPKKRYYGGNIQVDALENAVQKDALRLFGLSEKKWRVNVQTYSGSVANLAVYLALVPKSKKIMAMDLFHGGHLTHGSKVSITGKFWKQISYGVNKKTKKIDYDEILKIAKKEKPNLIIAGGSAYSRIVDFKKFREIANKTNSIFMVDMSHFAGLVAGRVHRSPFPYADVVTATTHKTLRGPRAALIFSRNEFSPLIDKAVFPGIQGGPHMNAIASVGIALKEAQTLAFRKYARQVMKNAKELAQELKRLGWNIVSGGTDTHLFLVDVAAKGMGGKEASEKLESVGIVVNKNLIPYDKRKPADPSGIRLGTPAMTTRGVKEKEMKEIARFIDETLLSKRSFMKIRKDVCRFAMKFPVLQR